MNISNKVSIPAVAGALTVLIMYGLSLAKIVPPPEVASACTLLVMSGLGYFVPHGGEPPST